MRHLANAQYWDRPAGGNTGRLFLAFGGPVCADRFSNCPLDRVLTYKNLIYLLNLQFTSQTDGVFSNFKLMDYKCFKACHTIVMIKSQVPGFICEGFSFLVYKLEQCI